MKKVNTRHNKPNKELEGKLVNILSEDGIITGMGLFLYTKQKALLWYHHVLIDGKVKRFDPVRYSLIPLGD